MFSRYRRTARLIRAPLASAKSHRHLLKVFIVRDIRGRFAGSMAGFLWALINPVATILIYLFVFSVVLRIRVTVEETGTDRFVIFFLSGFFPWLIFRESLSRSVGAVVENANLITKVAFPVELLPAGTVLSASITNVLGTLLFLIYLAFHGHAHAIWTFLPLLFALQMLFTWGLAYFLAAACVFIRDIRELLGIILMVWFYATPIIYPMSRVPEALRPVIGLNPMSPFVNLYRDILLLHRVEAAFVLQICILSAVSYGIGAWFFMRAKKAFGDVL